MNSQVVSINQALKSYQVFYAVASFIAVSMFLSSGFVSVSVIWFFAVCLYNSVRRSEMDWNRVLPLFWPIALYSLDLIWMMFSADETATLDLVLRRIHLLLIPLGFLMINKVVSDRAFHFILTLFLGGCVVCSLICIGYSTLHVIGSESFGQAVGYHFTSLVLTEVVGIPPIYFGIFCSFAVLIALESPFLANRAKLPVVMYLGGFSLLISSTVSSFALLMIVLLWFRSGSRRQAVFTMALSMLAVALSISIIHEFTSRSLTVENHEMEGETVNTIAARLAVWSFAAEAAMNAPLTGYGPALGQEALSTVYREGGFAWGVRESLNPHNQFFSTYLDLGIIGISILLALLIHSCVLALKSGDRYLLGFTLLIVIFFCFESALVRQKGIVFFSFFYSILIARVQKSDQSAFADNDR